jgi:hypothetical protein
MNKLLTISILCLYLYSCCSYADSTKRFAGITVLANQSVNLMVPRGLHETGMILRCDVEVMNFKDDDKIAMQIDNLRLIISKPIFTMSFKHIHLFGEASEWPIRIKNYDDTAIVKFDNCTSSYY